jgi:hypothetical protein
MATKFVTEYSGAFVNSNRVSASVLRSHSLSKKKCPRGGLANSAATGFDCHLDPVSRSPPLMAR